MFISTGEETSAPPVSGFVGLNSLRRKAVLINSDTESLSRLRVIPSMYFSCNGNISTWTFVALSRVGGRNTQYPRFQLWRPDGPGIFERVYESSTDSSGFMAADTPGLTIAEYVPPAPVPFESGYVLGLYQPGNGGNTRLSVIHAVVQGRVNFVRGAMDVEVFDTMASGVSASSDFPLVAVNTSKNRFCGLYSPCHFWLPVHRILGNAYNILSCFYTSVAACTGNQTLLYTGLSAYMRALTHINTLGSEGSVNCRGR